MINQSIKEIKQWIIDQRCGDSSCIYGCGPGQHTNGGCRCFRFGEIKYRIKAHATVRALIKLIKTIED